MRFVLLLDSKLTVKCTGQWHCGSTLKDELPDPKESLANNILSRAIEQANQKVQQDDRHSQHASNTYSNFCIFKFCELFCILNYLQN